MLIHLDIKLLYILSPGIGKIMGEGIAVAQSLPGCLVPSLRNCLPSCGVSSHFCAKSTKTSLSCSLIALLFSCSHLSAECVSVCLTSSVPIPGQPHAEGKECSCTCPPPPLNSCGQEPARTRSGVAPPVAMVSAEDWWPSQAILAREAAWNGIIWCLFLFSSPSTAVSNVPVTSNSRFSFQMPESKPRPHSSATGFQVLVPQASPLSAAWDMLSDLSQEICSSCHFSAISRLSSKVSSPVHHVRHAHM